MKRRTFGILLLFCLRGLAGESLGDVYNSICLHPDDAEAGHRVRACPGEAPRPGHPFLENQDQRSMSCETCAKEHRDTPELCRISQVHCENLRIEPKEPADEAEAPRDDSPTPPEPPSRIVPRVELKPSLPSGAVLIQNSKAGQKH